LRQKLDAQKAAFLSSTAGYEEKAQVAYRGDHLEDLASSVLDGLIDSAGVALVDDPRLSAHRSGG
jgi:hypothetical protein